MDEQYIRDQISKLRIKKNVSQYRMSADLGHSNSYIHSISSGRALPSMSEFLYICEYLGVTPKAFFDEEIHAPQLVDELYKLSADLEEADVELLIQMAKRLRNAK